MSRRKLTEFLALKQGNNSVLQYSQAFNTLSQYAGYHMDTDEKKQACFRQGLSSKLHDCLAMIKFDTFSELINGAIIQADVHLAHKAEISLGAVGPTASPFPAPATTAVGLSATSLYTAIGDSQAPCSSVG